VNQAAGLKEVHGYGKQLVDNVSVVTRLDKLTTHIGRLEERQAKLSEQQDKHRGALAEAKSLGMADAVREAIAAAGVEEADLAASRDALLSFRRSLEGEQLFASVALPISDLARTRDISFTLKAIITQSL